jgi:hypothetical protein
MAAAFHADQRIHHPLNAPLDDIFPDLAKLKPRWPTPAAKLSNYVHAVQKYDYQRDKHIAKRGDDDLIILNIYWFKYLQLVINSHSANRFQHSHDASQHGNRF